MSASASSVFFSKRSSRKRMQQSTTGPSRSTYDPSFFWYTAAFSVFSAVSWSSAASKERRNSRMQGSRVCNSSALRSRAIGNLVWNSLMGIENSRGGSQRAATAMVRCSHCTDTFGSVITTVPIHGYSKRTFATHSSRFVMDLSMPVRSRCVSARSTLARCEMSSVYRPASSHLKVWQLMILSIGFSEVISSARRATLGMAATTTIWCTGWRVSASLSS
mmetsp:Transcript_12351/g.31250  ORF Transcript_12351/g.31250 Transcript_12351/m.31250 type:complete len:219 (-) Transcript_12351:387-1043(-)